MLRAGLTLLLACWFAVAAGEELQPVPALTARVTDQTGTLSAEQRSQLEASLAAFEREKGAQIAVLIVASTQPETIEQYSIRVVEQWKLGRKGVADGVLLLIAKQDRKLRIEVGYGLEGALNDATAKRIIAETITPQFRERRFYEGINAGLERIMSIVRGEPLPEPAGSGEGNTVDTADAGGVGIEEMLVVGLVLVGVAAGVLRRAFGRFFGAAITGGIASSIAMLFVTSIFVAGVVGFATFMLALLTGGGGGYRGGRGWGGGAFGGSSSSSSWSSSSSSDSFSGGGGDFGGGGASGDW